MAAITQSFQKVIGSPYSAGAFSATFTIGGAGATATITTGITGVLSPGDVLIASSTTGGFTSGTTQILIQSIGYNAGGTGATCSFTGVVPSGACTVNLVSSATSTFNSGAINFYAAGDSQSGAATTRVISIQGDFTTDGTSTWTPINKIANGASVELIGIGMTGAGPFNVGIECRDLYQLNTSTGVITRGSTANVLNLALLNSTGYATIATVERGDTLYFNGLSTVGTLRTTTGTNNSLVLYNNTGNDLLGDIVVTVQ
jgi:hypothetical protein